MFSVHTADPAGPFSLRNRARGGVAYALKRAVHFGPPRCPVFYANSRRFVTIPHTRASPFGCARIDIRSAVTNAAFGYTLRSD